MDRRIIGGAAGLVALVLGLPFACGGTAPEIRAHDADDAGGLGTGSLPPGASRDGGVDREGGGPGAEAPNRGACGSADDCPGGSCIALVDGGYRTCLFPLPTPQECTDAGGGPFADECCGSCAVGVCTLRTSCGGAHLDPYNVCATDECAADGECGAGGLCTPAPPGGVRRCIAGNECRVDADCTAGASGVCAVSGTIASLDTCSGFACGGARSFGPMRCFYGDECASDDDCPEGHCEREAGRPTCKPGKRSECPPPP